MFALVQNCLVSNKTLAVIGLFQKSILYFIGRVPRNPYLLTITVGLVTSRGLGGAFSWVLLYSSGLNVNVGRNLLHTCWDWVSMLMAAGMHHLFRICFPHVIAFLIYFFIHVSESLGTMRSSYLASVASFAEGSLFVLPAP